MSGIRTVIFDIGNVLTRFAWDHFSHRTGLPEELVERVSRCTVENPVWAELDRGILSYEEVLERFIAADPEMEPHIRDLFSGDMHGIVERVDYAIPWIESLKARGLRVLVLSNFPEWAHHSCMDALDFLNRTDGGILSYADHVLKPDPEIYELLIRRYELNPGECVFLDDRQENLEGAKPFGIRTILFQNYEQAAAELDAMLTK